MGFSVERETLPIIQSFEGSSYYPLTADQLDASNRSTSTIKLDVSSSAERDTWRRSLSAAEDSDTPNTYFSTSLLHEISVADKFLFPFIFQRTAPQSHSPASYMLPQAPNSHTTTGGDGVTDIGAAPNVEGKEFISFPFFEYSEKTMNLNDKYTGDADIDLRLYEDERQLWNQPRELCVAEGQMVQASDSVAFEQVADS